MDEPRDDNLEASVEGEMHEQQGAAGPGESGEQGDDNLEASMEGEMDAQAEDDLSDELAMMELTAAEERVLDQHDITNEARRHLRSLMVALEQLQGHGEGAEYRWGVAQLVRSWDEAIRV